MNFPWLTVFFSGKHATSAPKKVWSEQDVQDIVTNTQKYALFCVWFRFVLFGFALFRFVAL